MNIKYRFALLALVTTASAVTLGSCASSNFNGYYSGTWSGTISSNGGTGQQIAATNLGLALYQTGSTIYGDFTAAGSTNSSLGGTIQGTGDGSTMTLTFTIPAGQYINGTMQSTALTLTSTLTLSGTSVTGAVTGTNTSLNVTLTQTK